MIFFWNQDIFTDHLKGSRSACRTPFMAHDQGFVCLYFIVFSSWDIPCNETNTINNSVKYLVLRRLCVSVHLSCRARQPEKSRKDFNSFLMLKKLLKWSCHFSFCIDRKILATPLREGRPGSSVGIATDYGLDGPWIESRWGRDFPPVQTGPGAHPASCTMGTGSFPGVKCGRGVLLTTHPLLAPWSWKGRAIPLPPLWATNRPVTGLLYFTWRLTCVCARILSVTR